jgi:hypothetical protein
MIDPIPSPTRLLLDPWSADYSPSVQMDGDDDGTAPADLDLSVETAKWSAQPPGVPPTSAWFIDGVRRLEARVLGWQSGEPVHGLFGSFATGATTIEASHASFASCVVERRLVFTSGLSSSTILRVGNIELSFTPLATVGTNPNDLVLALQNAMRHAEGNLAATCSAEIAFLDGPLAFVTEPEGPIASVIKTIHRLYLDPERMNLVLRLSTGERTPIFAVREGRKDRYSWYLRIGEARSTHHALSGIVRLEARAAGGIAKAVALAQMSSAYLPKFASTPARDPRAPQNLTPVGALEEHLRNRMGDATLIQRAIERRISEGFFL